MSMMSRLQHEGPQKGVALEFNDVCVTLNKNNILKNVYGMATVGQMLAVMGPSGTLNYVT
jgi:ABC-type transporter Mla maintaining outer membrane lipid asymmetry ATPase subunit MlaF